MQLNQENLSSLSEHIAIPTYQRNVLKSGIVHIGVGGFHRSHQAYYLHQLLQHGGSPEWGICGVGLREADRKMNDVLNNQDGLYTLVTQHPDGSDELEVIGSIHKYLLATDNSQQVVNKMAEPSTKIISLTITEGGYNFDVNTGAFNFDNSDIQHELNHPNEPKTVFGYLTAALRRRKNKGLPPVTIMSCDNIQHNGDVAKKMILTFAHKQDPELAHWIDEQVTFPNTMVDRITPVTTSAITESLKTNHHIADQWCVICEPFIQWVVEDKFCNGRPPLESVGVQFVSDVTPYETMKIRLLNAGHSVLGIPGAIHGHPTIDACMSDIVFKQFMRKYMDEEVTPILGTIAGIDLTAYKNSLEDRFSNPNLKDNVSRICSESSAKLPKFLIPTISDNIARGGSIKYGTFILAAWCYYSDKGIDENGFPIEIIDVLKDELQTVASGTKDNWDAFLSQTDILGDIVDSDRFRESFKNAIKALYAGTPIRNVMQEITSIN